MAVDSPTTTSRTRRIEEHYEGYSSRSTREVHGVPPGFGGDLDMPRVPSEISSCEGFTQYADGYDVGSHYMDRYVGKCSIASERRASSTRC